MSARVRSVAPTPVQGSYGQAEAPLGVQEGDVLLAFHSSDAGSSTGLRAPAGGAEWANLQVLSGGIWAGTKIWGKVAGPAEPDLYDIGQNVGADGVVTIVALRDATLAGITIVLGDTDTPAVSPPTASGVDIRYGAGLTQIGGTISWSAPDGYVSTQVQSGIWTSSCLATRTYASSATRESVGLQPQPDLYVSHGFTVLVASAPAPPVPEPPTFPAWAPSKGDALYQYVFRRLLDRAYLGHLDLAGVSFDKRIGQPGSFSATIPIPSRKVGNQVAEIIPRDDTVLDRGPGVISCEIYRSGVPWGEYWVTSATPSRSGRGTPAIALSGSTLDAYFAQVEIQDDLGPYSTDQVTIARALITHLQSRPYAGLSLVLQPGASGVACDREYLAAESSTYGQRLQELVEKDGGFEWMINLQVVAGALQRRWVWGYPKLGTQDPPQHVFVDSPHGGDVLSWSEQIDALRGATRWRASGSNVSTDASTDSSSLISAVHEATAHLAAGWPRIDRTVAYSDETDPQTLEDYAAYWAVRTPGAVRVDQVTVTFGANPSLTPNSLGDTVRIYLENEWHLRHSRVRRVIGLGITPVSRGTGKEEAQLVLEGRG